MKTVFRILCIAIAALSLSTAMAQVDDPVLGWSYDPVRDGFKSLAEIRPIEGCMVAGGLQKITSTDEPGSGAFWCGPPPFCLTDAATPINEVCTILQYARRNPRYDPNGTPGANGVRDPEDLRCVNSGDPPIAGRCPPPCAASTLRYGSCSFGFSYAKHGVSQTINSTNGYFVGSMRAQCNAGTWQVLSQSCVDTTPPPSGGDPVEDGGSVDPNICSGSMYFSDGTNTCRAVLGNHTNGWIGQMSGVVTSNPGHAIYLVGQAKFECRNGTYVVRTVFYCGGYDGD